MSQSTLNVDIGLNLAGQSEISALVADLSQVQALYGRMAGPNAPKITPPHWASGVVDPRLGLPAAESLIPLTGDLRLADAYGLAGGNPMPPPISATPIIAGVTAGAAVLGGAGYLGFNYGKFELQTQRTAANSNMARDAVNTYRTALTKVMGVVAEKWPDLNQVFYHLFNLGWAFPGAAGFRQTVGAAETIAKLSLATGGDPTAVTNAIGGAMNAFGINLTSANVTRISDLIHGAAVRGNIQDVGQLAQYIPQVTAFAGAVGGPAGPFGNLNDALEIVATLTFLGTPVSKAVTQAGDLYQHILHPSTSAETFLGGLYYNGSNPYQRRLYGDFTAQGLQQVGITGILSDIKNAGLSPEQLLQLFPGYRGGRGILQLMTEQGYGRLLGNVAYGPGAGQGQTDKQYEAWTQTLNGRMTDLWATLSRLGLYIGAAVEPHLKNFISDLSGMTGRIASFLSSHPNGTKTAVDSFVQFFRFATGIGEYQVFFGSILPASLNVFKTGWSAIETIWQIVGNEFKSGAATVSSWWKSITDASSQIRRDFEIAGNVVRFSILPDFQLMSGIASTIEKAGKVFFAQLSDTFSFLGPVFTFIEKAVQWVAQQIGSSQGPIAGGKASDAIARLFGVAGTFSGWGQDVPGVQAADSAGLQYFHAATSFAGDYDYSAAPGSAIALPGWVGKYKYQYLGDDYDPRWGNLLAFRTPNGGTIRIDHVVGMPNLVVGRYYTSGEIVGAVGGWDQGYSSRFWTGPHLGIVVDQLGRTWITQLTNGGQPTGSGAATVVAPNYNGLPTPPGTGPDATGKPLSPSDYLKGSQIPGRIGWIRAVAAKYGIPVQLLEAIILQNFGGKVPSFQFVDSIGYSLARDLYQQHGDWTGTLASYVHGGPNYAGDPLSQQTADSILSMAGNLGLTSLPGTAKTPQQIEAGSLKNADTGISRIAQSINRVWHGIDPATLPEHGNNGFNQTNWLRDQLKFDRSMQQFFDNQALIAYLSGDINKGQYVEIKTRDQQWRQRQDLNAESKVGKAVIPHAGDNPYGMTFCQQVAHQNVFHRQRLASVGQLVVDSARYVKRSAEFVDGVKAMGRKIDRDYHAGLHHM